MSSIYGLLNIKEETIRDFSLQSLSIQRNTGIDRILNNAVRDLKEIALKASSAPARPEYSNETIEEIIEKVKKDASKGGGASWNLHELRILSFYLMRLQKSEDQFMFALNLLKKNWINIFINGIAFFILNSWTTCSEFIRHQSIELLKEKMSNYDGIIDKYVRLKKHLDFFDDAGPMRMAALIAHNGIEIHKAPEVIGYNKSNLSLTYFSEVILFYIKRQNLSSDEIEEIFNHHSLIRTKKLAMANLIDRAEKEGNAIEQSNVSRCARRVLGYDITLESTWAPFSGATADETKLLKHAHELVTSWYARKSVETFFEVACQDKERRSFWLKYVNRVKDFRIVGSQSVRKMLQSDGRLTDTLRSCFIETRSKMSQTAALVLYIEQKVFVEFSDTGALYVYDITHNAIKDLKRTKEIADTKDLKTTSINSLVEQDSDWYGRKYYNHYEQGKLPHSGYWQDRLESWLKTIMNINNDFNNIKIKHHNQNISRNSNPDSIQLSLFDEVIGHDILNDNICKPLNPIESRNISIICESKTFIDNKICVIASNSGYYIKSLSNNLLYPLRSPLISKNGSIWVKKKDSKGYHEIVHNYILNGEYNLDIVGYIKRIANGVIFQNQYFGPYTFIDI